MKTERIKFWEVWGQSDALYEQWANEHGLKSTQLFVFYALDQRQGSTQKMLAEYTGIPKQTINGAIRSLKANGYITLVAESNDRREKRVVLTEKGRAYSQTLLIPLYELEERVFSLMGAERVQQLIDSAMLFNLIFEKEMVRRKKENDRKNE